MGIEHLPAECRDAAPKVVTDNCASRATGWRAAAEIGYRFVLSTPRGSRQSGALDATRTDSWFLMQSNAVEVVGGMSVFAIEFRRVQPDLRGLGERGGIMSRVDWRERVTIDPDVHHGDPCIKGTRVPVSVIVGSIADGTSVDEVRAAYPQLSLDDTRAAMAYAAEVLKHEVILPLPN